MRVEEMALRSEIRQMLNEAGLNRETIKQMVKETVEDVIKNQVNQVLMERRNEDLSKVVANYLDNNMQKLVRETARDAIQQKMRWLEFAVNVNVTDKSESENSDEKTKTK